MVKNLAFSKLYQTLLLCLVMVGLLIFVEQLSHPPFSWDTRILTRAYSTSDPVLDRFFLIITWAGSLSFLIPMSISIAWVLVNLKFHLEAWLLTLSLIGVSIMTNLAKTLFDRHRPDLYPSIGLSPENASFPSGHTTQIMAFVFALYIVLRRLNANHLSWYTVIASFLALTVAYSRIYLQVHYPSDVIAGFIMAPMWVLSVVNGLKIIQNKSNR
ncbi:MAG: phosphatase PAP2 family protein [Methylococcaceae bacterium]